MIILHAGILRDQILLWGEQSLLENPSSDSKRKGKRHPFSLSYPKLIQSIDSTASAHDVDVTRMSNFIVRLPSTASAPIPSSRLLLDENSSLPAPSRLSEWVVDGFYLHTLELVDLLKKARGDRVIAPGIALGGEFAYLAELAKFATALVARQQYLPSMVEKGGEFFARWRPVFSGDDLASINYFAEVMPHMVRAISEVPTKQANSDEVRTSSETVTAYLQLFVDDSVRCASTRVVKHIEMRKNQYLSAHDCWMHALSTASGRMVFDRTELAKLSSQITEWQNPISTSKFSQFRLCFRLEEPAQDREVLAQDPEAPTQDPQALAQDPEAPTQDPQAPAQYQEAVREHAWQVTYLLQDVTDQSLLIPADQIWSNENGVQQTFAASKVRPRELLLRSLGQASRLSKEVEASLRESSPAGFHLDNECAFNFLTQVAPALEQSGFGVMLPAWWRKGEKTKIKRELNIDDKFQVPGNGILEKSLHFNWRIAIGDTTLTEEELVRLSQLKVPLVQMRGQWMIVSKDDIAASIEFLQKKTRSRMMMKDALKMALTETAEDGTPVKVLASGAVKNFLDQLTAPHVMANIPTPAKFAGELRDYQKRGLAWMHFLTKYGLGACLADDMGLGKTIQTLALVQQGKVEGEKKPVLLICPTSVVNNWLKESARFAPDLRVMVHHGAKRRKGATFVEEAENHDIILSTYGLISRDNDDLRQVSWSGIILDEAQNIKNHDSRQSEAAKSLSGGFRVALTGTPVENSVADLHSIMEFLNPNFLGSRTGFRDSFLVPIQVQRSEEARRRLKAITQPFILRRLKTDKSIIDDLPDKLEMDVFCTLTKEQVTLYKAAVADIEDRLHDAIGIARLPILLAGMTRMKQICNHPAQFTGDSAQLEGRSGKLERLVEILEEVLAAEEKALIFSQYAEMGTLIRRHLQEKFGREVLFLHGGVSRKGRDEMVERFQSSDGPSLFVLSVKAGGTGLNLTAANHVIHYDRWWNPAVEDQASDRAYRIGQKKNVQVRKLITAGTLEDKIDALIKSKKETADFVVGSGENWLSSLSNKELKDVFALSKEFV